MTVYFWSSMSSMFSNARRINSAARSAGERRCMTGNRCVLTPVRQSNCIEGSVHLPLCREHGLAAVLNEWWSADETVSLFVPYLQNPA